MKNLTEMKSGVTEAEARIMAAVGILAWASVPLRERHAYSGESPGRIGPIGAPVV
jgi:hypothetical protein